MNKTREYGPATDIKPSADDAILCTPFGNSPAPEVHEDALPTADSHSRLSVAGAWRRLVGQGVNDAQA